MFRKVALFIALAVVLLIALAAALPNSTRLSAKERQTVEFVGRAYFHGDSQVVLESLSPLMARANEQKWDAIDEVLARLGVPASGELLAGSRGSLVQQGIDKKLPKPGERETIVVLKTLHEQVSLVLRLKNDEPVLARPHARDASIEVYDEALWSLHVLENRLAAVERITNYLVSLAKSFPRGLTARLSDDDRAAVSLDYESLAADLRDATRAVEEREIEIRVNRLRFARQLLEQANLTKDKFRAAYTSELDARVIAQFFDQAKQAGRTIASSKLNETSLSSQITSDASRSRELAGTLTAKAQLLYDGLHWWLRGRYGLGPEVGGLAKSPAAMRSAVAQFGLFMPNRTPQPIDPDGPAGRDAVPRFDRRHHFWWAWEDRRLFRTLGGTTKVKERFMATLSQFW